MHRHTIITLIVAYGLTPQGCWPDQHHARPKPSQPSPPPPPALPACQLRMLILIHTTDPHGDQDAKLASNAAATSHITVIATKHVKTVDEVETEVAHDVSDDYTLLVFTIGHGEQDGTLVGLGKRSEVMPAIAKSAT